ncbi:MAG: RES family NAD+ phosphorylase, partial [Patescibacteria group bacterium]|nr:RES family NAD+ phosphorylase [Patescibacteria group bacterium]
QGGRFNVGRDLDPTQFPVFPCLYCGSDFQTAYAEKFGVVATPTVLEAHQLALRIPESFTAVRLQINISHIFDLQKISNLTLFTAVIRKFRMSAELKELAKQLGKKPPWLIQEADQLRAALLANDWRAFPMQLGIPANSQVFASLLIEAGFEGVLYPSSKGGGQCIAIFPQNFHDAQSSVNLLDRAPLPSCISSLNSESLLELIG